MFPTIWGQESRQARLTTNTVPCVQSDLAIPGPLFLEYHVKLRRLVGANGPSGDVDFKLWVSDLEN